MPGKLTLTPAERRTDEVLVAQRLKGRAKYGKALDHGEPRDWNRMALEETVDALQYLAAENVRIAFQVDLAREALAAIGNVLAELPRDAPGADAIAHLIEEALASVDPQCATGSRT